MKKYKNEIIFSVGFIAFIFIIFFMGQCNGKRSVKPTDDTSGARITQVEQRNAELELEVYTLEQMLKDDSLKIAKIESERDKTKNQYISLLGSVKKLPLTEAVTLMADNFADKHKISVQVALKDTGVVISPLQVKEVNIAFAANGYLLADNEFMTEELKYRVSSDSAKTEIIKKQYQMINGQDEIITVKGEQLAVMNKSLENLNKKYKGQKRQKYIYKFAALALLVFAAVK